MNAGVLLKRHSITVRMTVAVCTFIILFSSLMAAASLYYFKQELKATISSQQMTLLTVVAQGVDQKLTAARKTVIEASHDVTPSMVADPEAAQRFLDSLHSVRNSFDNGIYLFSKEGRIIAESPFLPGRRGRDISFRQYYQKTIATGKPVISAPFISTHTPETPAISITVPVWDKNGTLIAILGGSVNLLQDNFLGGLSNTRIAKSGYLYLVSGDRTIIMHPDRSRIISSKVEPGVNKQLDRALEGFEGVAESSDSHGVRSLSSFKHLQAVDWIVGANYPLNEAYRSVYRMERYFAVAVAVSVCLIILIVRLIMGNYTSALVRFAEHVSRISSKSGADRLFKIESEDEVGLMAQTFNAMIQDQDKKNEELFYISTHDALSGLYNRAYFDDQMDRLSAGRITPISVVMADIDDLKVFNDSHGHSAGDVLITTVALILLESFRAEDVVARIGGDEFAILLPGVDAVQADIALKRVRSLADKYAAQACGLTLSISLGCATVENPAKLDEAIQHADQQMYLDKVSRKLVEKESAL
ncbi:MAG: sensor domain-containing diguanylate cyclase [Oryzomonas sp.]|uniref:sensor domain-containing diguanylate cyclase n=1 Tax=Oryzomonas sp. TaxID=2855186 RepID=UPI00283D0E89|nr:sensor domain-containing diguanylate cyclase [Oryzomonas sp.]MDR3580760.1 sensor domain-containing diguanylate cyclase [Oryzomonas sp.]